MDSALMQRVQAHEQMDQARFALLDSGASHALRAAQSNEEYEGSKRVRVPLATRAPLWRKTLVVHFLDHRAHLAELYSRWVNLLGFWDAVSSGQSISSKSYIQFMASW